MNNLRSKDLKVAAVFLIVIALMMVAIFDGHPESSRKATSGFFLGPICIGYAFWGLARGRIAEISVASRNESPIWFWFYFGVFLVLGAGLLTIGILHFVR